MNNQDLVANYEKGTELINSGKYKESIDYLLNVVYGTLPDNDINAYALFYLGFAYFRLGNFSEANSWLERLTKFNPNSVIGYCLRARALCMLGKINDGEQLMQKAIELDQEFKREDGIYIQLADVPRQKALMYYEIGDFTGALECYEQMTDLTKEDMPILTGIQAAFLRTIWDSILDRCNKLIRRIEPV
jgi:tetratricopeptide (TPR) repeat protein